MASILQNPESLLFSIKASWCICLVSHALALPILGFVMPLWTSFHLSCKLPFWRLLSWFLLLGQGSFLVFSIVFSLYLRAHLPHDFTVSGWLPNQYRRLSPHLYWIQISLFNHCLIRSLGSLLGTWPEMKLWSWLFKITFSISVKVPPPILFKPYIWKSFSLLLSFSQFVSNFFPFNFQLHPKSGQLPPSQWHQPTPLTHPTDMAAIHASLPPGYHSLHLVLCAIL